MTKWYDAPAEMMQEPVESMEKVETRYPWADIPVGKAFPVTVGEVKLKTLTSYASRMGIKYKKRFKIKEYPGPNGNVFVVACTGVRLDEPTPVEDKLKGINPETMRGVEEKRWGDRDAVIGNFNEQKPTKLPDFQWFPPEKEGEE